MSWLGAIGRKLLKLFVDDVDFAVALTVWLLLAGLALPHLGLAGGWAGLSLFAGVAIILVESVVRQARR